MSLIFAGCNSLISLDSSRFKTYNVTTMSHMFNSVNLVSLDLINFNTSRIGSMQGLFNGSK